MKKKFLTAMTVASLAGVMCVGFAACGGIAGEAKGITGDSDVSEETWRTALDINGELWQNYKVEGEYTSDIEENGASSKISANYTWTVADGKTSIVVKVNYSGDVEAISGEKRPSSKKYELYYEGVMTYGNQLIKQNEKWVSISDYEREYRDELYVLGVVYSQGYVGLDYLKDCYKDFVYNGGCKGYLMGLGEDSKKRDTSYLEKCNYIIKIKEEKLAAFIWDVAGGDKENGGKYTNNLSEVYTFGGQTVETPVTE